LVLMVDQEGRHLNLFQWRLAHQQEGHVVVAAELLIPPRTEDDQKLVVDALAVLLRWVTVLPHFAMRVDWMVRRLMVAAW